MGKYGTSKPVSLLLPLNTNQGVPKTRHTQIQKYNSLTLAIPGQLLAKDAADLSHSALALTARHLGQRLASQQSKKDPLLFPAPKVVHGWSMAQVILLGGLLAGRLMAWSPHFWRDCPLTWLQTVKLPFCCWPFSGQRVGFLVAEC